MKKTLLMLVLWWLPVWAQDPMSLKGAVHRALDKNKSVEASAAAQSAAESSIAEARAVALPKLAGASRIFRSRECSLLEYNVRFHSAVAQSRGVVLANKTPALQ
jgi:outer membrane protein TolC